MLGPVNLANRENTVQSTVLGISNCRAAADEGGCRLLRLGK
jgi:hypothetical protein